MSAAHPDTQSSGSVTCCLLLRTHKNRPRQLRRTDTVCSHVGTNRKQPALTYPGPAPWESGWREPNAHASLAESARCPPFGLRRHAQCTLPLASEVQGNCSQTWRASREPSVPRFQSTTSLTDARSPCGQSPLGCRTESLVHASGHRANSHFFPKAPRSVRVSEEPCTSSELRPRGGYCGPAVVRIHCVSRQQSLDDADPISRTPGQKCAFRPLGVRPGVDTAVPTSTRSQTGAAMFT